MAGKLAPSMAVAMGIMAFVLAGIVGWYVAPGIFEKRAEWRMQLTNTTLSGDIFHSVINSEPPKQFKFYIFNITNPEALLTDQKLKFQALGPYVYDQVREKTDVEFFPSEEEQELIRFRESKHYVFNADESNGAENDLVTIPNVPLITAATLMYALLPDSNQSAAQQVIAALAPQESILKQNVPIKELLFDGWQLAQDDSSPWNQVSNFLPNFNTDHFALYFPVNGTDSDLYELETGINVSSLAGSIRSWNGKETLDFWGVPPNSTENAYCNALNATDGSIFSPAKTKGSLIRVFTTYLCRVFHLEYLQETEHQRIPTYRYVTTQQSLQSPQKYQNNSCFCTSISSKLSSECFDGAYRLYTCTGTPLVSSLPYFLYAEDLWNRVDMSQPNASLHLPHFDIEPETGSMLKYSKRSQINIELQNLPGYSLFDALPSANGSSLALPLYWSEETEEMPEEYAETLYDEFIKPHQTFWVVRYVILGIAGALVVGGAGTLLVQQVFLSR